MKTSVIISVLNEEKYIEKCLTCLTNQTEKADEIIVVDNNCTDKTITIVKKYKNIKIIKEEIQGMTSARNTGFNIAKGDILIKCDADTEFPPDLIKEIKSSFTNNPKCVGLTTPVYFGDIMIKKMSWLYYVYLFIPMLIIGDYPLNGSGYAVTKKVWDKVKNVICLDDTKVHEDIDLSFHIKKYGKIFLLKKYPIKASARRIKENPQSFFGEYHWRFIRMLPSHWF